MPGTRKKYRGAKNIPSEPVISQPQVSTKPGTDFYKYVNGNWIRHANMPPYLSSYGVSEEIEEIINDELMDIILDCKEHVHNKADKSLPHTTYLIGTLAESALNSHVQDLNIKLLQTMVSKLHCIRDTTDLAAVIGDFMQYRIGTVLGCNVVPPERDSSVQRFSLTPGDVGLPDPSYYLDKHTRVIYKYDKLLKRLSEDFSIPNLEAIIPLEKMASQKILEGRRESESLVTGVYLEKKYKHIPWHILMQAVLGWSPSDFKRHKILLFSEGWIAALNSWFDIIPIDQWKLWLAGNLLLHFLPLLPPPYDDLEFELYGHQLRGQAEKVPQKRLTLKLVQQWLTGSLGFLFVKNHVSPTIKNQATSIAEEIKQAAAIRASQTGWLEPKTRELAKKKVESIHLGVAYPPNIVKDRKTSLNPERLLENVLKLANLDFQDEMNKIDTKLNLEMWDEPIFSVNAFYYNEGNRLILPAGILRWPFFHIHASDGWNFGGLGATIGHEICHAFDNDGKDYDYTGNLNPWWSSEESKQYNKKVKELVHLYNSTEYFGHHLNGALTLSENIADLGGLSIALTALERRLKTRNVSAEERKKELCDFFTSYAVSWRTKEKREKAIQSLFMDVHAPPVARVNNIVCQFDEWYECFDIKPGDELYKPSDKRIRIF
jgi:predicted metalloendopeptidase